MIFLLVLFLVFVFYLVAVFKHSRIKARNGSKLITVQSDWQEGSLDNIDSSSILGSIKMLAQDTLVEGGRWFSNGSGSVDDLSNGLITESGVVIDCIADAGPFSSQAIIRVFDQPINITHFKMYRENDMVPSEGFYYYKETFPWLEGQEIDVGGFFESYEMEDQDGWIYQDFKYPEKWEFYEGSATDGWGCFDNYYSGEWLDCAGSYDVSANLFVYGFASPGVGLVDVKEFELYGLPYSATHTTASTQIDGQEGSDDKTLIEWTSFTPAQTVPENTTLTYQFRTSDNASDWTEWTGDYTYSGTPIDLTGLSDDRYLQVKATLTNTDGVSTPQIDDYTINFHNNQKPNQPVAQTAIIE